MKYPLRNGKEFEVPDNGFVRIAHFRVYFPNGTSEFIGDEKNVFYLSEVQDNRFCIIHLTRPSITHEKWILGFHSIQSQHFTIRVHEDESDTALDSLGFEVE